MVTKFQSCRGDFGGAKNHRKNIFEKNRLYFFKCEFYHSSFRTTHTISLFFEVPEIILDRNHYHEDMLSVFARLLNPK